MIFRKLDSSGDYSFGHGAADFLANSPECVAQAVQTRLALMLGEWFLDVTDGTPWRQQILGHNTGNAYDMLLKERILGTQGVLRDGSGITDYSSTLNRSNRGLRVATTVSTLYGSATVEASM